ncbi:hypothetical protein KBD08_03310 [Candidatus Babeliales bacterium]|nr:hypothetical protein [Candidatus Babeliales bacterium]
MKFFYTVIVMLALENKLFAMESSFEMKLIRCCLNSGNKPADQAENTATLSRFVAIGSKPALEMARATESEHRKSLRQRASTMGHRTQRDQFGLSNTGDQEFDEIRDEEYFEGTMDIRTIAAAREARKQYLARTAAANAANYVTRSNESTASLNRDGVSSSGGSRDGGDHTGRHCDHGSSGGGLKSITFDGRTYDCRGGDREMGRGSDGMWGH